MTRNTDFVRYGLLAAMFLVVCLRSASGQSFGSNARVGTPSRGFGVDANVGIGFGGGSADYAVGIRNNRLAINTNAANIERLERRMGQPSAPAFGVSGGLSEVRAERLIADALAAYAADPERRDTVREYLKGPEGKKLLAEVVAGSGETVTQLLGDEEVRTWVIGRVEEFRKTPEFKAFIADAIDAVTPWWMKTWTYWFYDIGCSVLALVGAVTGPVGIALVIRERFHRKKPKAASPAKKPWGSEAQ
ncbi:MAG: hypothetical protein AAGJ97_00425 [Planctomycetota bacterium]